MIELAKHLFATRGERHGPCVLGDSGYLWESIQRVLNGLTDFNPLKLKRFNG
jgi:hypothetical protein